MITMSIMADTADVDRAEAARRRGEEGGTDCHIFNIHLKNNNQ